MFDTAGRDNGYPLWGVAVFSPGGAADVRAVPVKVQRVFTSRDRPPVGRRSRLAKPTGESL